MYRLFHFKRIPAWSFSLAHLWKTSGSISSPKPAVTFLSMAIRTYRERHPLSFLQETKNSAQIMMGKNTGRFRRPSPPEKPHRF